MTGIKKRLSVWVSAVVLYMGFLVSLLSDRLLHLISFCGPLLRGGVLAAVPGCYHPSSHLHIALIKLNRCLSSRRQT